jgi:hypothetical protein
MPESVCKIKMRLIIRLASFFILLPAAFRCASDEHFAVAERNYFPLQTGMFWDYRVEETLYRAFTPPEDRNYDLRVIVIDSIAGTDGGTVYILHRYVRSNEGPWQFQETWSARLYGGYVIITEGNTSYARLALPVYEGRTWNGNLFNNLPADTYRITRFLPEFRISESLSFADAIEVEQENVTTNLTYRDVRHEVYADRIGLVFKESEVWTYRCGGGICTGEIENGYHLRQKLLHFGHE